VGCPWWGGGLCYSLYVALLQVHGVLPPLKVGMFSLVLDSFWRWFFGLMSQQDKFKKLHIKFWTLDRLEDCLIQLLFSIFIKICLVVQENVISFTDVVLLVTITFWH
jgi:hypothetical protein